MRDIQSLIRGLAWKLKSPICFWLFPLRSEAVWGEQMGADRQACLDVVRARGLDGCFWGGRSHDCSAIGELSEGSGFRVQGPGVRVQGSGFRVQVWGVRLSVWGFGSGMVGLLFGVWGLG